MQAVNGYLLHIRSARVRLGTYRRKAVVLVSEFTAFTFQSVDAHVCSIQIPLQRFDFDLI